MDERVYWIWAQQAFGAGSPMPVRLNSQRSGGLQEFCEGGPRLWNRRRDVKESEAAALRDFSPAQAEARLEYAEKIGWKVITPGCADYPRLLKNIPDPPAVLYIKGTLPPMDKKLSLAVVGSRKPLSVSEDTARLFGYQLAVARACVVSGGALGVDAAALSGALQIPDAATVSVLPVSLDSSYVQENVRLRAMICARGGALVSEYFSRETPEYGGFQIRNRLVTGLSQGVIIIQAGKRGGGQIYASRAAEQNRDVYVYPGPEGAAEFAGSRRLLSEGAQPVVNCEDVLAQYPDSRFQAGRTDSASRLLVGLDTYLAGEDDSTAALEDSGAQLSPGARRVWEALDAEPADISRLAERTGLPASSLLGLLTELELEGLAASHPGKRYSRSTGG